MLYNAPDWVNDSAPAINAENLQAISDTLEQDGDEIQALFYSVGGPNVATTVSAMTDQNKVYVYTGSETGYTAGNWYYYNGSAWVSGGVYNSTAVETDPTLTISGAPADAKATGDEVAGLKSQIIPLGTQYKYGLEPFQMSLFKPLTNLFCSEFCYHYSGGYYRSRTAASPPLEPRITTTTQWQGWLIRIKPNTVYTMGPLDYKLECLDLKFNLDIAIATFSDTDPNTITTGPNSYWVCLTQRIDRDMSEWMMVEGGTYPSSYVSGYPQWAAMPKDPDGNLRYPSFIYCATYIQVIHYSDRTEVIIPSGARVLTHNGWERILGGATLTATVSTFLCYNATQNSYDVGPGENNGDERYFFGFITRGIPKATIFGAYTEVQAKTIAFMGDSITAGVAAGTCFHEFVHDKTRYTCLNYGFGGAGYYRNSASQTSGRIGMGVPGMGVATTPENFFTPNNIPARLTELDPDNTDCIVIFAGTNDFGNNVSLENFRTAVASSFEYAQAHFPAAPILVMTPIHRISDTTPNTQNAVLRDYCDIIIDECIKHGVAYIDTMTVSGLNPNVAENCALYFPDNLTSGLHPGVEGHRRLASVIWRTLSDMIEYHNFN